MLYLLLTAKAWCNGRGEGGGRETKYRHCPACVVASESSTAFPKRAREVQDQNLLLSFKLVSFLFDCCVCEVSSNTPNLTRNGTTSSAEVGLRSGDESISIMAGCHSRITRRTSTSVSRSMRQLARNEDCMQWPIIKT